MHDEHHIRQRAYEIWEQEGRPDGRHDEHWAQARQEIEADSPDQSPAVEAPEDASPTVTAPDSGGTTPGQAAAAAAAVNTPRTIEPRSSGQQASAAGPSKGRRA
jgi:hypothetical protein